MRTIKANIINDQEAIEIFLLDEDNQRITGKCQICHIGITEHHKVFHNNMCDECSFKNGENADLNMLNQVK